MAAAYCPIAGQYFCAGCAVASETVSRPYQCWEYSFRLRSPWTGQWRPDLGYALHEGTHPHQADAVAGRRFAGLAPDETPTDNRCPQRWTSDPTGVDSASLADDITAAWDNNAAAWDAAVADVGDDSRRYGGDEVLLRLAGPIAGRDVLDLGCGNGYLCRRLAGKGARVTGVDPSPKMIAAARQREIRDQLGVRYVQAGAEDLGALSGAAYDLVIANHVLTAVVDLPAVLAEARRVLRPGGTLVAALSHPAFSCGPRRWVGLVPDSPRLEEFAGFAVDHYFRTGRYLIDTWRGFSPVPYVHRPLRTYWRAFTSAGFSVTDFDEPDVGTAGYAELPSWQIRQLTRVPSSCAFALTRLPSGGLQPGKEGEVASG
ncbi:class I SAM-dependent methyltransferase [Salinispora arenicola]|uniref:class I SAM-dependent methyltransferase n=1 Tax=Salinispora arenicola TaxID=168697 RepID=UPI0039F1AF60